MNLRTLFNLTAIGLQQIASRELGSEPITETDQLKIDGSPSDLREYTKRLAIHVWENNLLDTFMALWAVAIRQRLEARAQDHGLEEHTQNALGRLDTFDVEEPSIQASAFLQAASTSQTTSEMVSFLKEALQSVGNREGDGEAMKKLATINLLLQIEALEEDDDAGAMALLLQVKALKKP